MDADTETELTKTMIPYQTNGMMHHTRDMRNHSTKLLIVKLNSEEIPSTT